jgi:UDP-N-acetylglucosamine 4-epimerase
MGAGEGRSEGMNTAKNPDVEALRRSPKHWLITGVAGFIGAHLLEALLRQGQTVTGLDNFSTGQRQNLARVEQAVGAEHWQNFTLIEGDIRQREDCAAACAGAEIVLHQAALVSVPLSIQEPELTHAINVEGFQNLLEACRAAGVGRLVYASSSAVYGDTPTLPLHEDLPPRPLSPYAASKLANEQAALTAGQSGGMATIGLRYFNVYGEGQDPKSAYTGVITAWLAALIAGRPAIFYGDGSASRDFCAVADVVAANLLAATTQDPAALRQVYNIGTGRATSLTTLYQTLKDVLADARPEAKFLAPDYQPPRAGDILHSVADIGHAARLLGFAPRTRLREGLEQMVAAMEKRA